MFFPVSKLENAFYRYVCNMTSSTKFNEAQVYLQQESLQQKWKYCLHSD